MKNKILIVDDEKNIRLMLRKCLPEYELYEATDGVEALHSIKSQEFDLVLLDIKMPGITGMQVLQKIREEENNVAVVMMTAYGTIERAVEAMKLGAIDFINKPFTPEEIKTIVNDIFRRQTLEADALETYKDLMEFSKKCILEKKYADALEFLKKAVAKDVSAPEPHNLIGVMAEYKHDFETARKHYLAALALDGAYVPAQENLSRVTRMYWTMEGINLGDTEKL